MNEGRDPQVASAVTGFEIWYIMDPMCSWCWAFRKPFAALESAAGDAVSVRYVMGGLAPDSDQPMPLPLREAIEQTWRAIKQRTGATFNHEFWRRNVPRRSTYPACRAAIAAGLLRSGGLVDMVEAIQNAYYREARNPSQESVLADIAEEIGLERTAFLREFHGEAVSDRFNADLELVRRLGVGGFPTVLAVRTAGGGRYVLVCAGYCDAGGLVDRGRAAFADLGLALPAPA